MSPRRRRQTKGVLGGLGALLLAACVAKANLLTKCILRIRPVRRSSPTGNSPAAASSDEETYYNRLRWPSPSSCHCPNPSQRMELEADADGEEDPEEEDQEQDHDREWGQHEDGVSKTEPEPLEMTSDPNFNFNP